MHSGMKLKSTSSQSGFTMLESLVTLLILTIGVLGVAGLQMQGMRSGGMALQRTIVVMKTQEIIERMRINRGKNGSNLVNYSAGVAASGGCNSGTVCTAAAQAAHDLFSWQQDLTAMLPAPAPVTTITAAAGPDKDSPYVVTVTVNWNASNGSGTALALTYNVNAQI